MNSKEKQGSWQR